MDVLLLVALLILAYYVAGLPGLLIALVIGLLALAA
jgi:hypothetical protein